MKLSSKLWGIVWQIVGKASDYHHLFKKERRKRNAILGHILYVVAHIIAIIAEIVELLEDLQTK